MFHSKMMTLLKPAGERDPYMSNDGIERSFQVNFLGHYLLTELLKDHLVQDNGRLISVLCDSGRKGVLSIDPDDKNSACKDIKYVFYYITSSYRPNAIL